jgi:hypothetical protein
VNIGVVGRIENDEPIRSILHRTDRGDYAVYGHCDTLADVPLCSTHRDSDKIRVLGLCSILLGISFVMKRNHFAPAWLPAVKSIIQGTCKPINAVVMLAW